MSQPWSKWMTQIFQRVGQFSALSNTQLANTLAGLPDGITIDANGSGALEVKIGGITYQRISNYRKVTGTVGLPVNIASQITPSGVADELIYCQGSGGPVTLTGNPQIIAGTLPGQRLTLRVPVGGNGILISDGTGISMNGPANLGVDTFSISFEWDGSVWVCTARD